MDLDVTELYSDPVVGGDPIQVIRRPESVNDFGETVITELPPVDAFAAVYPTGDNSLVREEAYSQGVKTMTFATDYMLRTATKDGAQRYQPDIVVWPVVGGDRYVVRNVKDYSRYGAGFIEAECISEDFIDEASTTVPPAIGQMDFTDPQQSGLIGAT